MSRANSFIPAGTLCPMLGWFGDYYDLRYFRRTDSFVAVTPDIVSDLRRLACAWANNDIAFTINGQAQVTNNAQPLIASALRLVVGAAPWSTSSSGNLANATMRSFAYYPRRLTNAQLQAMTT